MARKPKRDSGISYRLEEPIRVPFKVVGTPEWIKESIPADFSQRHLIPVHGVADLRPVREELAKEVVITVDTESWGPREKDGLDPISPSSEIVLAQLGNRRETYLIQPKLLYEFRPVLESEQHLKLLQNAVHDFRFILSKYGIHLLRMYCTMLAEQSLTAGYEGLGVGLAELVRRYPPHRIISKNIRNEFIDFKGYFSHEMLYYGARDNYLLYPVYDGQSLLLKKHGLIETARLEFDNIPSTAEMGMVGVILAETYLSQTMAYNLAKRTECEVKIFEMYNKELVDRGLAKQGILGVDFATFNISSNDDKSTVLSQLGFKVEDVDKDTLLRIDHPIARLMFEWSEFNKPVTTYGQALLNRRHWHTRRIHPNFDQLGAGESAQRNGKNTKETIATGRYSSDFQQLPRPEKVFVPLDADELAAAEIEFRVQLAQIRAANQQKMAA